jgi:glutamate synthase domain-containing protein 2/nitrite reductase/ring-hydroxylating ferredoxin subunit
MKDPTKVCKLSDLQEGIGHEGVVNGRPLALFLHQGRVYALEDRCPHREGQLSRGKVDKGDAVCPLHGWNFDLKTGISPYDPRDRVPTYPVELRDGEVFVDAAVVPPLPDTTFAGYQGRWRRWEQDARGHKEIRRLAKGLSPQVEAMGAPARELCGPCGFDHFHIRAAQLERLPRLEREPVQSQVRIGEGAGRPLELALPALVSHMSFGALSREAKIALARGSAEAHTAIGSGEGGMLGAEREAAGIYILEMASGYFGWREEVIARADAVEIKLGQSAKPGLGGELPGGKVRGEIAEVRGLAPGSAAHSPSRFPDIENGEQLAERMEWLRSLDGGARPLGIKLVANDVAADVTAALELMPDFITIDGFGGGTGAAPADVRDNFGMPLVMALPEVRRLVDVHNRKHPQRPVSVIAAGGVRTPADIVKAVALGADACALATAALFALGCEYYRACGSNGCPVGIATQDPNLRRRLDVDTGARRVAGFFSGTRTAIETYLRIMGYAALAEVSAADLIPLTLEASAVLHGHPDPGY